MFEFFHRFMKSQGATLRIVMGQVSLVVSLMLLAAFVGVFPDANTQKLEGRVALAEALASNSSILISQSDIRRIEANLQFVVKRNPDLLSAAVRRKGHGSVVTVGDHESRWQPGSDANSQLSVPIWEGDSQWGQVELRFEPINRSGLLGFLQQPLTMFIAFMAACCSVLFFFFLRRMLKHLDPSQAIPDRVRSALDTVAEGLLVMDAKQNIVLANSSFANLMQVPATRLLGRKAGKFEWTDTKDRPLHYSELPWSKTLRDGKIQRSQVIRLHGVGDTVHTFQTNCSAVLTSDDKVGGVLVSFDDITRLEEKEAQLRQSKHEAEEANRAKSDFLANMSHEIRTPMNAIMGFTEILKRAHQEHDTAVIEADSVRYLNTIASSSKHLLDLINDILDLSKVEAGHVDVESIPCSVHMVVFDVLAVMRGKAEEKSLFLEFVPDGPLPETITSDPARLRQILLNLVGNAVKFTKSGGVKVVTRLDQSGKEPTLSIEVIDTGIGMSDAQAEEVFSPFKQADSSITRRFGGTGLGLAICKRFAEAMGGDVSVTSELGVGSTFALRIPTGDISDMALNSEEELRSITDAPESASSGYWKFDPATVLVTDDSPENRELLQVLLEEYELDVVCAENGQMALERLAEHSIDIVLMDVEMPVMDGYTAVGKIRERGLKLPVLALTAHAMRGAEERCLQAGFSGYLTKPIVFDDLLAKLAEDLEADFVPGAKPVTDPSAATSDRVVATESSGTVGEPIYSSLPAADDKFKTIIERFVDRLNDQTKSMQAALAEERFEVLKDLGHWLKGSPGSVGFHHFDKLGLQLEQQAKLEQKVELGRTIDEITLLVERVLAAYPLEGRSPDDSSAVAAASADHGALESMAIEAPDTQFEQRDPLPDVVVSDLAGNQKMRPVIEKFARSLSGHLVMLDHALESGDLRQVGDLAHQLKGTAGSVGFGDFTRPATSLETSARQGDADGARTFIEDIRALHGRIDLG